MTSGLVPPPRIGRESWTGDKSSPKARLPLDGPAEEAPVIQLKGAENMLEAQLFSPWCRLLQGQRGHSGREGPSALTER